MAESDSIMQLGIEAAREGNKEEARNLFRLLTRQEPDNAQAWLWLAGVAENREERQAALEQVLEYDPDNEMAQKGLQAMGVNPTRKLDTEEAAPPPPPVEEPDVTETSAEDPWAYDEDDPFAALDSLSEVMSGQPGAVRRAEQPAATDDLPPESSFAPPPSEPEHGRRGGRSSGGPAVYAAQDDYEYEEETEPARRGVNPFLLGLIVIAIIALLAIIFWPEGDEQIVLSPAPTETVAPEDGEGAAGTGETPAVGTPEGGAVPPEGENQGEEVPPEEATLPEPIVPEGEPEPAEPEPQPPSDPANVNTEVVAPGTALESSGWQYIFAQPTFATPIIGGLGNAQPDGRFVVVLALVTNTTGQPQNVPRDFFVLKDAQGRVYEARPELSTAYINQFGRGIAADLSQEDQVPSDGLQRSVPIVFDVEPDATELKFFARSNPDQGWLVLPDV
jgi:hypothetical protein